MAGKKPVGLENSKYAKVVKFAPADLVIIGIDTDDGEEHPDYDPRIELPLDEAMLESIKANGVQQVVDIAIVDGQPVVIDGRQRVRHAREAGVAEVTANVHRGLSDSDRTRFAIRANMHRQDDDQVTEAEKAARLTEMEVSDEDICTDFGWSIGTLRNRRKLVDGTLPKSVLAMVRTGKLTVSAAMALHKRAGSEELSASELADEAKELAEGGTSKQASRARGGKGTSTSGVVRPGIRLIAKMVAAEEALDPDKRNMSEDARQALKWVLGELEPAAIKGMTAAIKATAPEPKKVSGKKAPPRTPPKKKGK